MIGKRFVNNFNKIIKINKINKLIKILVPFSTSILIVGCSKEEVAQNVITGIDNAIVKFDETFGDSFNHIFDKAVVKMEETITFAIDKYDEHKEEEQQKQDILELEENSKLEAWNNFDKSLIYTNLGNLTEKELLFWLAYSPRQMTNRILNTKELDHIFIETREKWESNNILNYGQDVQELNKFLLGDINNIFSVFVDNAYSIEDSDNSMGIIAGDHIEFLILDNNYSNYNFYNGKKFSKTPTITEFLQGDDDSNSIGEENLILKYNVKTEIFEEDNISSFIYTEFETDFQAFNGLYKMMNIKSTEVLDDSIIYTNYLTEIYNKNKNNNTNIRLEYCLYDIDSDQKYDLVIKKVNPDETYVLDVAYTSLANINSSVVNKLVVLNNISNVEAYEMYEKYEEYEKYINLEETSLGNFTKIGSVKDIDIKT